VFLEIGQDVHIADGDLESAVNEGVRQGYKDGYLRKSIVAHPFSDRINTQDNTPAVTYSKIVSGVRLNHVMSKGSGAENKSKVAMLKPGAGTKHFQDGLETALRKPAAQPLPAYYYRPRTIAHAGKSRPNG
jgi:fumarate hydratase subunit alpha